MVVAGCQRLTLVVDWNQAQQSKAAQIDEYNERVAQHMKFIDQGQERLSDVLEKGFGGDSHCFEAGANLNTSAAV